MANDEAPLLFIRKDATYAIIATDLLLGTLGITLNATVAAFYLKKTHRGRTVPFLYTVISLSNLVTCTLALCHVAVLFLDLQQKWEDGRKMGLILACYMTYVIVTRASVFHNLLLSLLRSINIALPFYQVKWTTILPLLIAFYIIRLVLGIFDTVDYVEYHEELTPDYIHTLFTMPMPGEGLVYLVARSKAGNTSSLPNAHTLSTTLWSVTLVLPCLLMILTSIHQCCVIFRKENSGTALTQSVQLRTSRLNRVKMTMAVIVPTGTRRVQMTVLGAPEEPVVVRESGHGAQGRHR